MSPVDFSRPAEEPQRGRCVPAPVTRPELAPSPRRPAARPPVRTACLAGLLAAALTPSLADANPGVPTLTGVATELSHEVQLSAAPEGLTLDVTRTFFNPGFNAALISLTVELPCSASLDDVALADGSGWARAKLLEPDVARERFDDYTDLPPVPVDTSDAPEQADTAALVTRDSCNAQLELYPVPRHGTRTVAYRLFFPSSHENGAYGVVLPVLDDARPPSIKAGPLLDAQLQWSIDGGPGPGPKQSALSLDGDREHHFVISARDPGHGWVRAADIDLPGQRRLQATHFAAPRELATLPPVRRVVVLLDGSHSVGARPRKVLRDAAVAYLEALADQSGHAAQAIQARAQVIVFDRGLRPLTSTALPARWAAEDLAKLSLPGANGSNLDLALAEARTRLAEPTSEATGVDWIVVFSDLDLRHDFDVAAERLAAEGSPVRMHFVQASYGFDFAPAPAERPWSRVASAAAGVAWEVDMGGFDLESAAAEWLSPTRIWGLERVDRLRSGDVSVTELLPFLATGASVEEIAAVETSALERVSFRGHVWGQLRSWTAQPRAEDNRRTAALLATDGSNHSITDESDLASLARFAAVVSPYTAALAEASFGGPPPGVALLGAMVGGLSLSSSFRSSCGSGNGVRLARGKSTPLAELVADAVASCAPQRQRFAFETTGPEVVAVTAPTTCLEEALWSLDLHQAPPAHARVEVSANARGRLDLSISEFTRAPSAATATGG